MFDPKDVHSWFIRVEAQFRLARINDTHEKADHILSIIPNNLCTQINPWLAEHNYSAEYEPLKAFLIQRFSPNAETRARQLLAMRRENVGDTTPRELWCEIQNIVRLPGTDPITGQPKHIDLVREVYLNLLPDSVRTAMEDVSNCPIEDLLKTATRLCARRKAQPPLENICTATPEDNPTDINTTRSINHKKKQSNRPQINNNRQYSPRPGHNQNV